jgi:hypothetical protein
MKVVDVQECGVVPDVIHPLRIPMDEKDEKLG